MKKTFFLLLFLVLSVITCFIMPHGDDFLYLNYFENISNWHYGGYKWVNDCILLPRGFWRPWEDILGTINAMTPGTFPYLNHIIITLCHVICGYLVYNLSLKLAISDFASLVGALFFMFATNSMGGLLSVDSIAQVLVSLFGLLSVYFYCKESKTSRGLWFLFAVLAFFAKESGFVWIFVGPIFNEIIIQKRDSQQFSFSNVGWPVLIKKLLICIIPVILYLGIFYLLSHSTFTGLIAKSESSEVIDNSQGQNKSMFERWTNVEYDNSSHEINAVQIVKSAFVLYGASLIPIDTSAIYYKNYDLLAVTILLSLLSMIIVLYSLFNSYKQNPQLVVALFLLLLWTSSVSLLTRAGEISPHPSNAFMGIMVANMINAIEWNKIIKISAFCFCLSTLITDAHKYYLCYKGGDVCRMMGEETVNKTIGKPNRVLCISVENKKGDGAFIINPENDYRCGAYAIMLYNYAYPQYRDVVRLDDSSSNVQQEIDSIVNVSQNKYYDCIWIQKDGKVNVMNLK